jgi:hypothetical protein
MRGHDHFHPAQHLQAALCLPRLGGAGAETIDEGGDLGDALQLTGFKRLLQGEFLGTLGLELRVVAGVGAYRLVFYVQHPVDDGIEKLAIMRDHQQRSGIGGEPVLEPHDGVEIEMVGGLIEQQQIRTRPQGASHGQTHAPAAGEFGDRARQIGGLESKSMQQRGRACLRAVAIDGLQRGVQLGQFHRRVAPFGRLDGGLHAA